MNKGKQKKIKLFIFPCKKSAFKWLTTIKPIKQHCENYNNKV